MANEIVVRSYVPEDVNTLKGEVEGLAVKWNHPSKVTDDGGTTFYMEALSARSVEKTLNERGAIPVPLGVQHVWQHMANDWDTDIPQPVGTVRFRSTNEGLVFRAKLHSSDEAKEALDKLTTGELGEVSLTYAPHKSDTLEDGTVLRTEIQIYEMSLVKTGTAQFEGAKVLAVRSRPNIITPLQRLELLHIYTVRG